MESRINLNADLGEGDDAGAVESDAAMLDIVASANIACGFHAGDPLLMVRTVTAAVERGVSIGAHPGYRDREGFGRRPMALSTAAVEAMVAYQVGALAAIATAAGGTLTHVKPHGALNNLAAVDRDVAMAIARSIKAVDGRLIFLAPAGSEMVKAGRERGLPTAEEVFADRNYAGDGTLLPRSHPRAMVHDPAEAAANVLRMVREGTIRSIDGRDVPCHAQSVCVHGDTASAVAMARHLREAMGRAGITIVPLPAMLEGVRDEPAGWKTPNNSTGKRSTGV